VNFYLSLVEQSSETEEPSTARHVTYGDNVSGAMLPVYTSPESFAGALKAYASAWRDFDYIRFDITDPFELTEIIGPLEAYGLKSLLFDPPPAPDGKVWILGGPVPVGEYRKAIEEIRP
jgi:hypothetical protein